MSITLTTTQLDQIEDAAYDVDVDTDDLIYRDYSGRGMYGESCFGLSVGSVKDVVRILVRLTDDDAELAGELAQRLATDSLGCGTIAYFPGVTAPEDDE